MATPGGSSIVRRREIDLGVAQRYQGANKNGLPEGKPLT
jgi:hypothetical protein